MAGTETAGASRRTGPFLDASDWLAPGTPYTVILSSGRSGSNMLLQLYDGHPDTFCRNEPMELSGTLLKDVFVRTNGNPIGPWGLAAWHAAVTEAGSLHGERDHLPVAGKRYFRQDVMGARTRAIIAGARRRHMLGLIWPTLRRSQWPAFRAEFDHERFLAAHRVLKVSGNYPLTLAAFDADAGQRLVHIVREPRSYLRSWYGRFVQKLSGGESRVWLSLLSLAPRPLAHYGIDPDRFRTYSLNRMLELQLWSWRYANECLALEFGGHERYRLKLYSDVMADRTAAAQELSTFSSLSTYPRRSSKRCPGRKRGCSVKTTGPGSTMTPSKPPLKPSMPGRQWKP